MKKQFVYKMYGAAALALCISSAWADPTLKLEDIEFWTGSGPNQAALLIEWKAPEVLNNTEVPAPVVHKILAWGYRWEGEKSAVDMFNAITAADPRLFVVLSEDTGYGSMIMGLGYDLNNNRIFGIRKGSRFWTYSEHSDSDVVGGAILADYGDADVAESLEPTDLYWGGVYGPAWELWCEAGNQGGFSQMPDPGQSPYWTADDPLSPWSGTHGQWSYASMGVSGTALHDGSWIAFTISAGGLDYANPTSPGTVAYNEHKSAPHFTEAAPLNENPYPTELSSSHGPFSRSTLYADPLAALGEPTTWAQNLSFFGEPDLFHIKLVEPPYNVNQDGKNVLVTLEEGEEEGKSTYGSLTVKFDHPVLDDPANPYGIDFQVFGNTFYVGKGFVSDTADMRTYQLSGGAFAEPLRVSVSPDGQNWYTYQEGPYCDDTFPTQAFHWDGDLFDSTGNGWSKKKMDFTKPVNPALKNVLGATGTSMFADQAIMLYEGSGGGTGFDLKESGFDSIQYVRIDAAPGYTGGEVDAFSDVRPACVGESLCVVPSEGGTELFFQNPARQDQTLLQAKIHELSSIARVKTAPYTQKEILSQLKGSPLTALSLEAEPLLEEELTWKGDLQLNVKSLGAASAAELELYAWNGEAWVRKDFESDEAQQILLPNVSENLTLALIQAVFPSLEVRLVAGEALFTFTPKVGWVHTLERTSNFVEWTTVQEMTPETEDPLTVKDPLSPEGRAFYRLRLTQSE